VNERFNQSNTLLNKIDIKKGESINNL